ncbi:MAG: hypothetical protein JNK79_04070 [Chitinophagaceae bacterium]|nr:hypothetical protein [Chitinophagaceae bacterium]
MDSPYNSRLSDVVLTSVFAGFATTLLCMVYYLLYKEVTGYPFSSLLNVSSLIFGINTLFVTIGCIYYLFIYYFKRADLVYILVSAVFTVLAVWYASTTHRSEIGILNSEFHQLLIGLLIIIGAAATIGLPVLYHNKKFHDSVL